MQRIELEISTLSEFSRLFSVMDEILRRSNEQTKVTHRLHFEKDKGITYELVDENNILHRQLSGIRFFADSHSHFHHKKYSKWILSSFSDEIANYEMDELTRLESELETDTNISANGRVLRSDKLFDSISAAFYYQTKPNPEISKLMNDPCYRLMFSNSIGNHVISLIRYARKLSILSTRMKKKLYEEYRQHDKCIYCLKTDQSFTSEEHVIPYALGNHSIILPRGYVCDKCNSTILSELDSAVHNFPLLKPMSVLVSDELTRRGKYHSASMENVSLIRTAPNSVNLFSQSKQSSVFRKSDDGIIHGQTTINICASKKQIGTFKRGLVKIALGLVAFYAGHEIAITDEYAIYRKYIQGNKYVKVHLYLPSRMKRIHGASGWIASKNGRHIYSLLVRSTLMTFSVGEDNIPKEWESTCNLMKMYS